MYYNYTSAAGGQFSELIRDGQTVTLYATPSDPSGPQLSPVNGARADLGLYERIQGDPPPDEYYAGDDPPLTLSFEGTEYDAVARVRETNNWVSWDLEDIRAAKVEDLAAYAEELMFLNAQYTIQTNLYIHTDIVRLIYMLSANWFLTDRHKDRVLGEESGLGYRPGTDPDPTTYWPRDIPLAAVNSNNGNEIRQDAGEVDWGQVAKSIGLHVFAIVDAMEQAKQDIDAATTRTQLVGIDVTDALYGWPPVYLG